MGKQIKKYIGCGQAILSEDWLRHIFATDPLRVRCVGTCLDNGAHYAVIEDLEEQTTDHMLLPSNWEDDDDYTFAHGGYDIDAELKED